MMTSASPVGRPRHAEAGFTLVELLVTLVLFGLLSVAIFDALRFGGAVWRTAERHTVLAAEFAAAEDVLRRTISQAYPAYASADPADRRIRFQGTARELDLIAPLPAAIGDGLMGEQRLFAESTADGLSLVMAWRLDLPPADPHPPEASAVLVRGLTAVDFSYFGPAGTTDRPDWTEQWQNRQRLPQLVRIRLERPATDGGRLPDLIIEPKLTVSAACRYDPVGPTCRRT